MLVSPRSCSLLIALSLPAAAAAQSDADQIARAVLPLPESARAGATVHGYRGGEFTTLRQGTGDFVCLADQPGDERFHVSCYHKSLEPYMARGRELRASEGLAGQASIQRRWQEIEAGTLKMPEQPAALYQLITRDPSSVDVNNIENLNRLTVIYMPYATAEETGFPAQPTPGVPWMMYSGRPTAHLMISN